MVVVTPILRIAAVVLGTTSLVPCGATGNGQQGAAPDSAPAPSAAPASTSPARSDPRPTEASDPDCAAIRLAWEARLRTFVGQPHSCKQDTDCECYGGPICPNALVQVCPAPVRAEIARELSPYGEQWNRRGCPVIWSPYGCNARCVNGACASVDSRPGSGSP